ncbi:MAG: MFS transporter [Chloroflexota bacterium]|nr:MFS transporter [Chloroflexota bacterium]MDE2895329.1 MFS transporter [Chloroflexota bacterium]
MSRSASPDSAPTSAFARNIPLYYLFQFVRGFHFWLPVWFLFLQSQHGLSYVQIGLMEVLFGIATIAAEVPTGAIADRFGRRVALGFGALGFAGATVLFALLNFPALIVGHLFMSITRTLMSGSDDALLFDSLRQLKRTDEYERHAGRSSAVGTSSLLAATILAGPLVSLLDFRAVIIISAVGMGLAGLIALTLREPPRREADINGDGDGDGDGDQPPSTPSGIAVLNEIRVGLRISLRNRQVLWAILFGGVLLATLDLPEFFIQPFVRSHGVDPSLDLAQGLTYSSLMLPSFLGLMIGAMLAAPLAARLGERWSLPAVLIAGLLVFIPLLLVDHLALVASLALLAAATAAVQPLAGGYINRRIPSDQRATVLSIFSLCTAVMITIVIGTASALVDAYNFQAGFAFAFAILLIGGILFWTTWRRAHANASTLHHGT